MPSRKRLYEVCTVCRPGSCHCRCDRPAFAQDNAAATTTAAAFNVDTPIEALMADPGIVRNRAKIEGAIKGARIWLDMQERGSFARYLWGFVDGRPIQGRYRTHEDVPTQTKVAEALSKDLKARGFSFVGPTIVYAFMEATGLVNDHLVDCFRHEECAALGRNLAW